MARHLCSGKGFALLFAVSFAPLSQCLRMGGGGMYFVFSSKVCHGLDIFVPASFLVLVFLFCPIPAPCAGAVCCPFDSTAHRLFIPPFSSCYLFFSVIAFF